jgi:hypothetical protein
MRRITRRIGLFGPGAVVKATGARTKRPTTPPGAPAPHLEPEHPETKPSQPEKQSWWSRLIFGKDDA